MADELAISNTYMQSKDANMHEKLQKTTLTRQKSLQQPTWMNKIKHTYIYNSNYETAQSKKLQMYYTRKKHKK